MILQHTNTNWKQYFCINLIEDGVTDAEDVDYNRVLQQRQQVVGHALPEMQQKVLDLKPKHYE